MTPRSASKRVLLPSLLAALLIAGAPFALAQDAAKASRFYEDALQRYEKRDISGAIVQLKNALQADKTQLSVHVLLGKALARRQPAGRGRIRAGRGHPAWASTAPKSAVALAMAIERPGQAGPEHWRTRACSPPACRPASSCS
jgi:hypothetical protein